MQRKKYRIKKRFIGICLVGLMAVILVSTFLLTRLVVRYWNSREVYSEVAQSAIITPIPQPAASTPPVASTVVATPTPTPAPTPPIKVDWLNLRAMNKHIIGWLYCDGTEINYPIAQSKDNAYYLTHNVRKKDDQAGSLFLDYRNNAGKELENMIIYGHRMKDGSMFGELAKFSEVSYRDKHTEFYLLTPERNYKIIVFSCRTVRGEVKYFPTSFTSADTEKVYWNKALSQSYWQKAPSPKPEGAIMVTLATCSKYDFSDSPRLLVHGWAVPMD